MTPYYFAFLWLQGSAIVLAMVSWFSSTPGTPPPIKSQRSRASKKGDSKSSKIEGSEDLGKKARRSSRKTSTIKVEPTSS